MLLSIIIPIYNRPEELDELFESLERQTMHDYEVIVVEDGSLRPSAHVVERYRNVLPSVQYLTIPNSGPSTARNVGAERASGEYLLILDSDVVLPEGFLLRVQESVLRYQPDAWGGPDAASPTFSPMQRAISYAMTSLLTTGGIRGGSAGAMEQFKPRTFNMGCRRSLFLELGGFDATMRYGEDIDFSLRLIASGAKVCLFVEAYVYHKRRANLEQFFRQVYHSGQARVELERRHPGSTKPVHYLPTLFVIYSILALASVVGLFPLLLYALLLFVDAHLRTGSLEVAVRAVPACFVQLWGYGFGWLSAQLGGR